MTTPVDPDPQKLTSGEKFWAQDPCVLFNNLRIFPTASQTRNEKLNALTRLAIILTSILYYIQYEYWFTFLILSLLIVLLLKYGGSKEADTVKEGFTITPTYTGLNLQETSVAPLFAEEWQIYPPAYDLYTNVPPPTSFEAPLKPQSYPYGQYLTRTNMLPSDEYNIHMLSGGPRNAREYANSAFLRNDLAFRENLTRLYKKQLNRRFRHSCNDTFSPYYSY